MRLRTTSTLEFATVILAFILVNLASGYFQPLGQTNGGKGTDGLYYYKIAIQFNKGKPPKTEAPFVYRVGTPIVVALCCKENLIQGFQAVNITLNGITVLLLVVWLRNFLRSWLTRVFLCLLFITIWHGPVRFIFLYPVYTDPSLFVFLLAGLIGIKQIVDCPTSRRILLFSLLCLVGVIFREMVLVIPIVLLFSLNPISSSLQRKPNSPTFQFWKSIQVPPVKFFTPLGISIFGLAMIYWIAEQTNDHSFIKTAYDWAYLKPLLTYIHAWFITFGPLILLPVLNWRRSVNFLVEHQYLLLCLLIIALLAWIGGSGTERFLFWGMPVVYVLIGLAIEEHWELIKSPALLGVLLIAVLITQRAFWILPDLSNTSHTPFPILTILSNDFKVVDLYSYYGTQKIEAISLLEYLFLSAILFFWLRIRKLKLYKQPN